MIMNDKYSFYIDVLNNLYKHYCTADDMRTARFYIVEMMKIISNLDDIKLEDLANEKA